MSRVINPAKLSEDVESLLTLNYEQAVSGVVWLERNLIRHKDDLTPPQYATLSRALAKTLDELRGIECEACETRLGLFNGKHLRLCAVCAPGYGTCVQCGDDLKLQDAIVMESGDTYHRDCAPCRM